MGTDETHLACIITRHRGGATLRALLACTGTDSVRALLACRVRLKQAATGSLRVYGVQSISCSSDHLQLWCRARTPVQKPLHR